MTLSMTEAGVDFLSRQEGFRPGETFDAITEPEAQVLLGLDVARIAIPVQTALRVELKPHQADAVLSLAFNVGGATVAGSTLLRLLNAGNIGGAADQFLRWNRITVDGKKTISRGLSARRERERALFLFADYGIVE